MASSSSKVEIEKFDGSNDFGLWKMKMLAHLGNLGLDFALEDDFLDYERRQEEGGSQKGLQYLDS